MMPNFFIRPGRRLLVILGCTLLLIGCGPAIAVRYYQLARGIEAGAGKDIPSAKIIGLGPVLLPEYLTRPQIVTRISPHRLQFADSHRWAEPLADNVERVLSENLSSLLGTDRILIHPWPRSRRVDCQVRVEVIHFEAEAYGPARLEARWAVLDGDGKILLVERRSNFTVPQRGPDYEDLVAALSETLAEFSREINSGIKPFLIN